MKQAKLLPSICTCLLLSQRTSTGKLPAFIKKLKKSVHAIKVNETKVTLRNAFLINLFALGSEKE